jgi:hypothetical protein
MKSALRLLFALVVISWFAGCVSSTTKLRLGMTKDEVIAVMGQPISVAAQGKNEDLNYSVSDSAGTFEISRPYFVRLVDGRVEAYGQANQITPIRTAMPPPNNSALLRLGMTKDEAIATMGKPISVSAEGNVELLNYSLPEYNGISPYPIVRPYSIRLTNGKVDAFAYTKSGTASGVPVRSSSGYPGPGMPEVRDAVRILSVEPAEFIPGKDTAFKMRVKYAMQSSAKGTLRVMFNTRGANAFVSSCNQDVTEPAGEIELTGNVTAVDWGDMVPFKANVALETIDANGMRHAARGMRDLDLKKSN